MYQEKITDMALKTLKELKVGDEFKFNNPIIMKGTYRKKSNSFKGYCLIGDVSLPGDVFASSEKTLVEPL